MLAQALSTKSKKSNPAKKTPAKPVKKGAKAADPKADAEKAKISDAAKKLEETEAKKKAEILEKKFQRDIKRAEIRTMKKLLRIDLSLTDSQLATFVQPSLNKILEKYNKPITPEILASSGKKMADAIHLLMIEKRRKKRADNNLDIGLTVIEKISAMTKKICEEEVETKTDTRVIEACAKRYSNRIIEKVLSKFLNKDIQKNLEMLPTGSIPEIGRQKLAIDRMSEHIQEAKISLDDLKRYQENQLGEASDRLNFMEGALGNMEKGYTRSHNKRSRRREAIHQEKKRLNKIMSELDAKRNEIEDINGMVENNEHIYENFEKLRGDQAALLKRNIPKFAEPKVKAVKAEEKTEDGSDKEKKDSKEKK